VKHTPHADFVRAEHFPVHSAVFIDDAQRAVAFIAAAVFLDGEVFRQTFFDGSDEFASEFGN